MSRRTFLRALATTAATVPLAGCDQVDVGWVARMLVPPDAEADLGRQAFQQIMSQTPIAQDPGLHERVTRIGERIVQASNSPYPDWQFVVFAGEQANAFALPGGRVGVFTGMLEVAANEDQLATVLGHEVGHVNARHGAERMVTEHLIALGLRLVATLLAFGDVQIPPDLLVALGASAAELGIVRPFSRTQELEADAAIDSITVENTTIGESAVAIDLRRDGSFQARVPVRFARDGASSVNILRVSATNAGGDLTATEVVRVQARGLDASLIDAAEAQSAELAEQLAQREARLSQEREAAEQALAEAKSEHDRELREHLSATRDAQERVQQAERAVAAAKNEVATLQKAVAQHRDRVEALQQEELGEQIDFTGQELADIVAFVHAPEERRKFSEADVPPALRRLIHDR